MQGKFSKDISKNKCGSYIYKMLTDLITDQ